MQSVVGVFIDENLKNNYLGGLVIENSSALQRDILHLQDVFHIFDEIKYSQISAYKIGLYEAILDYLSQHTDNYSMYIQQYSKIRYTSYYDFSKSITTHFGHTTHFAVFVDYFTTPHGTFFDENILASSRKIIYSLQQNSKSNILLQMSDLLLGLSTKNIEEVTSPAKKHILHKFRTLDFPIFELDG